MEFTQKILLNTQINENGISGNWEYNFIIIEGENLIIKLSEDSQDSLYEFKLYDLIILENKETSISIVKDDEENSIELEKNDNDESQIIIKFQNKSKSNKIFIIEMQSQDMLDNWLKVIKENQVKQIQRNAIDQEELNGNKNHKYSIYYKSSKNYNHYGSKKINSICIKFFTSILFVSYTIGLAILFALLWTKYVGPILYIDDVKTDCLINSNDWRFLSKGVYIYDINVTYQDSNNITLTNTMKQYCYGSLCPLFLNKDYPKGDTKECHYDKNDESFVYFWLYPMIRYRLTITLSICGPLFLIWLIWVAIYIFYYIQLIKRNKIFK